MIEGLGKGLLRCGYCHGEAHGLLEGCADCGILLHADCRRALGRCATLGCSSPSVQSPSLVLGVSRDEEPDPPEALHEEPPRWARIREAGFSGLLLSLHRAVLPLAVVSGVLMGGYTLIDAFAHSYRSSGTEPGGVSPQVVRRACQRFRLAEGRWPESLDELIPRGRQGYLEAWPSDATGQDFVLIYRGREAWLGVQRDGPESLELHARLFVKPAPVAACGLPPQSAHVRAHQLSRGQ